MGKAFFCPTGISHFLSIFKYFYSMLPEHFLNKISFPPSISLVWETDMVELPHGENGSHNTEPTADSEEMQRRESLSFPMWAQGPSQHWLIRGTGQRPYSSPQPFCSTHTLSATLDSCTWGDKADFISPQGHHVSPSAWIPSGLGEGYIVGRQEQ